MQKAHREHPWKPTTKASTAQGGTACARWATFTDSTHWNYSIQQLFMKIWLFWLLKRGQIKKLGHFILLIRGFFYFLKLLFLFDLFLEARAEILEKISFFLFLGDLKTPKGHFGINWPLGMSEPEVSGLDYDRSVNTISTRWADYAHHITNVCPT